MAQAKFNNSVKPGDLIEIFRGMYQHWAVYIGGEDVVHMVTPCEGTGTGTGTGTSSFGTMVMALDTTRAVVKRQNIKEVVGSDHFRINNLLDDKYQPRERHIIVRDACRMVGLELPYSVTTNNCEHFVTELRYGKPESRQVQRAVEDGSAAVAAGVAVVGLVAAGAYLLSSLLKKDNRDADSD